MKVPNSNWKPPSKYPHLEDIIKQHEILLRQELYQPRPKSTRGRSYNSSIFEPTSKWLHFQPLPILLFQSQYLKDSLSLIQKLGNLHPPYSFIFSFDVKSLYLDILPKLGVEALRHIIYPHFSLVKTNLIYTLGALSLG